MGKDSRQNNEHAEIPANLLGHDLTWLNSRSQTDSDGECHCPVCNPRTEGLCLAPLLIHMVGKEITRMSGMQNDDRLGDDVPESLPSFVEIRIVKILFFSIFSPNRPIYISNMQTNFIYEIYSAILLAFR